MKQIEQTLQIPVRGSYDVIVAGGGVAGVAAAVAAARQGCTVLLIEKTVALGGLATNGLINLFVAMCNGRGRQIIKGMAQEFVELAMDHDCRELPEDWREGEPKAPTAQRLTYRFSAPLFSLKLTELVQKEGVDLLFDTAITRPVMEGRHCRGLAVENKSGAGFYEAGIVVDTTGDADVLYRAGMPTVERGNFHTYIGYMLDRARAEEMPFSQWLVWFQGGNASLYGKNHPEGKPLWHGTNGEEVSRYLIENQLELLGNYRKLDPKTHDLFHLPAMPQFRTTRRIDGDAVLHEGDVYRHSDTSIAAICDFDRRDYLYEVPYGTLVRTGWDNLITAGRSAAGDGYGWDVLRVIPPAILTGQAAGNAAALALREGCGIDAVPVAKLQAILEGQNVMIHFNDTWIPAGGGGELAATEGVEE